MKIGREGERERERENTRERDYRGQCKCLQHTEQCLFSNVRKTSKLNATLHVCKQPVNVEFRKTLIITSDSNNLNR